MAKRNNNSGTSEPEKKYDMSKQVNKICPKCNTGNMWPNGIIHSENPSKFEHHCLNCGYKESFDMLYPYMKLDE